MSGPTHCFSNAPALTRQPMEAVLMAKVNIPASAGAFKCCKTCGETKSHSEFYIDKRDGRPMGRCKPCWVKKTGEYARANPDKMRAWGLKSRLKDPAKRKAQQWQWRLDNPGKVKEMYRKNNRRSQLRTMGITMDVLVDALASQNGLCAICQTVEVHLDGGRQVHIDHCHKTMKFRGILCLKCNTGLGKFGDDPERLTRAASYLRAASSDKSVQFRGDIIKV